MIDQNVVWRSFRDVAAESVGSRLSQLSGNPVIQKPINKTGKKPNLEPLEYPYLVIDILDRSEYSPTGFPRLIDENDNTVYRQLERMIISFNCYGHDSQSILHDFHFYFSQDFIRDRIREETGGALLSLSEPTTATLLLNERHIEVAEFNATWTSVNELTDISSGLITTTEITYN